MTAVLHTAFSKATFFATEATVFRFERSTDLRVNQLSEVFRKQITFHKKMQLVFCQDKHILYGTSMTVRRLPYKYPHIEKNGGFSIIVLSNCNPQEICF